jgi:hypothetical protein
MSEFEKQKKQVLQPIYFEAGAALFDCQSFEYAIKYLLYLFARFGAKGLDVSNTVSILENEEKKTAGQLIKLLKLHLKVSEGLEETLVDSLKARNELIHHFLINNLERIVELNEHESLLKELRSLRSRVQKSQKQLDPFIKALAEMMDGVSIDDIANEAKAKFMLDTKQKSADLIICGFLFTNYKLLISNFLFSTLLLLKHPLIYFPFPFHKFFFLKPQSHFTFTSFRFIRSVD